MAKRSTRRSRSEDDPFEPTRRMLMLPLGISLAGAAFDAAEPALNDVGISDAAVDTGKAATQLAVAGMVVGDGMTRSGGKKKKKKKSSDKKLNTKSSKSRDVGKKRRRSSERMGRTRRNRI